MTADETTVVASLFKNERITLERVEKFISREQFTECNLRSRLYKQTEKVLLNHADFGHERVDFWTAKDKLAQTDLKVDIGFEIGPTWSTHWFKVTINVPESWKIDTVHLRWDSNCEAMIWSEDGKPLQGGHFGKSTGNLCWECKFEQDLPMELNLFSIISPKISVPTGLSSEYHRTDFTLPKNVHSTLIYYLEVAANAIFGAGKGGTIEPPDPSRKYRLQMAEIAVFDPLVYKVIIDLDVLLGMARFLPENGHRRLQALYTANHMNGSSQLTIMAVGNCHIDTAWLWTYSETRRKCARSWASTLNLMDVYPQLTFAVSQAQQLVWLREDYPELYCRIVSKAKSGRFVGVGGSWVEMDGNLPNGESFVRQLLYGQREFFDIFGRNCDIFWLPDTFGYSAQLPQIISQAGMSRFVTQKMSWSVVNRFPNSSFWWIGLDGSKVLAHFPPHHYVSEITVKECLENAENHRDKGRSNAVLMLYGHGDGGGGPTSDMLERMDRLANCDQIPKVVSATPGTFFDRLEKDSINLCEWRGELYLEMHNGTYTTHGQVKKMNRKGEFLLRDAEFLQAARFVTSKGTAYKDFAPEWKLLLLNQFHDVLPGTSIFDVYVDAKNIYRRIFDSLIPAPEIIRSFLNEDVPVPKSDPTRFVLNSLPWKRTVFLDGQYYRLPASSIVPAKSTVFDTFDKVTTFVFEDLIVVGNKFIRAKIDSIGRIVDFRLISDPKMNFVLENHQMNRFVIFDDVPLFWDAWDTMDYHLETRKLVEESSRKAQIIESGPKMAKIAVELIIEQGKSLLKQIISLHFDRPYLEIDCFVDWAESRKMVGKRASVKNDSITRTCFLPLSSFLLLHLRFLKVEFPVNIHCNEAIYDIQFGHVSRPNHRNTSWDSARYEVCGHKWAAVCEFDRGFALLNDCKYGYNSTGNILTLSLLRAPKAPDPHADMGRHEFSYAIFPFTGRMQNPTNSPHSLNVMRAAYEFNIPAKFIDFWHEEITEFIVVDHSDGVMIDTVKVAENGKSLLIRLFENFGGRTWTTIRTGFPLSAAFSCNFLEEAGNRIDLIDNRRFCLQFSPFQIQSILLFIG